MGERDRHGLRGARRRLVAMAAVVSLAGDLTACSTVQVRHPDGTTEFHDREEFAAYVEHVFRFHNRVLNDLIMATALGATGDAPEDAGLQQAERRMTESCHPLNAAIAARIEGRRLGFFEGLALPQAVPACEAASRRLEALIPSI
ncbi:MAG: hypothetical protein AB7Q81_01315 [Gammaproteobacteria bacterium]